LVYDQVNIKVYNLYFDGPLTKPVLIYKTL